MRNRDPIRATRDFRDAEIIEFVPDMRLPAGERIAKGDRLYIGRDWCVYACDPLTVSIAGDMKRVEPERQSSKPEERRRATVGDSFADSLSKLHRKIDAILDLINKEKM